MTVIPENFDPVRQRRRAVICLFCSRPTGEFVVVGENPESFYCSGCFDLPRPYGYGGEVIEGRLNTDAGTPQYASDYEDDDL